MGIFIHMNISKSITKKEWAEVYDETVHLIQHFPFAERRKVDIHGVETICLVKTQGREHSYGWGRERERYGWSADGDLVYMKTAENYFLPRDLICDEDIHPNAGDAMLGALSAYLDDKAYEGYLQDVYELWGEKTQAEPYHIYLLAVACLIENRLGSKAFIYGDITRGQCRKAVEIANKYLERPIEMPDRCYTDRLFKRVQVLDLTEEEKMTVFEYFFLGTKDAEFGEFLKKSYSEEKLDVYWENKFKNLRIGTTGFNEMVSDYLLWKFDIDKLCSYVCFEDKEGNMLYKEFVTRILDAKLHIKDKNCADPLRIDPEQEEPYSIWTLFAQFEFAGASNKKVDRYVPIEEIRTALKRGLCGKYDVDPVIDDYLEKESRQSAIDLKNGEKIEDDELQGAIEQDASETFGQIMDKTIEVMQELDGKYDINEFECLLFYKSGDSMRPSIAESIGNVRNFLDRILEESYYVELAEESAERRLEWLVKHNHHILIKDSDWEKVYQNLVEDPDSFARYYPLMRTKAESDSVPDLLRALMINDELYLYSGKLADNILGKSETEIS